MIIRIRSTNLMEWQCTHRISKHHFEAEQRKVFLHVWTSKRNTVSGLTLSQQQKIIKRIPVPINIKKPNTTTQETLGPQKTPQNLKIKNKMITPTKPFIKYRTSSKLLRWKGDRPTFYVKKKNNWRHPPFAHCTLVPTWHFRWWRHTRASCGFVCCRWYCLNKRSINIQKRSSRSRKMQCHLVLHLGWG